MSWRFFQAASAVVLAFSCGFCSSSFAADAMGSVVAVQGRPVAAGPSGSRPLSAGSDVFEGDTVTVGDGNAQLQLDDGTKIVVGPSSRLVLQAYLRRNSSTASKVGIKALRGTFRFITGTSPKSAYNINTSNATIGIRGTGLDFTVTDRTLIAVLEGAIRARGNNGGTVNTQAGCGVAEAGGGATKARELNGEEKASALQNQLPYVTDQSGLDSSFYLPINNCLTSLGENQTNPGLTPLQLLPLVPAIVIPAVILGTKSDQETPVSPEGTTTPDPFPNCDSPQASVSCD